MFFDSAAPAQPQTPVQLVVESSEDLWRGQLIQKYTQQGLDERTSISIIGGLEIVNSMGLKVRHLPILSAPYNTFC